MRDLDAIASSQVNPIVLEKLKWAGAQIFRHDGSLKNGVVTINLTSNADPVSSPVPNHVRMIDPKQNSANYIKVGGSPAQLFVGPYVILQDAEDAAHYTLMHRNTFQAAFKPA